MLSALSFNIYLDLAYDFTPVLQTKVTVFLLLGESLTSGLKHHSAHKYPLVKGLLHSPRLLKKKTRIRQTAENKNGRRLKKKNNLQPQLTK